MKDKSRPKGYRRYAKPLVYDGGLKEPPKETAAQREAMILASSDLRAFLEEGKGLSLWERDHYIQVIRPAARKLLLNYRYFSYHSYADLLTEKLETWDKLYDYHETDSGN